MVCLTDQVGKQRTEIINYFSEATMQIRNRCQNYFIGQADGRCYDLDVSPQVPCIKGLVATVWCYWKVVEPLRVGVQSGHWRHSFESDIRTLAVFPLLSLSLPWMPQNKQLPLFMVYCLAIGPKATGTSQATMD
jgi:hypothetical protein